MSRVVLELHTPPAVPLEAPCVRPDRFAELSEPEIARLPVWHGNEEVPLGDFFRVTGGRSADVHLLGDASRVKELGAGMTGGSLRVEGNAGMHTGARMSGGHLRVEGRVGDWAGAEMTGGALEIRGDAGSHLAAAYAGSARGMNRGVVLVHGSAGEQAGARMRRGLIAVAGGVGPYAAAGMIAGSLLVCESIGRRPGAGMKRGTILAGGTVELLPTFRFACTYRPDFVALYLRRLREAYAFPVENRLLTGAYRRYTGDYTELGKGEILQWTEA